MMKMPMNNTVMIVTCRPETASTWLMPEYRNSSVIRRSVCLPRGMAGGTGEDL